MKLSTILILSFIFVGIVGGVFGTYSYYVQSNELLEKQVSENLELSAHLRANYIVQILEEQREKMQIISSDHHFKDFLTLPESDPEYLIGREHGFEFFKSSLHKEMYELYLLDAKGVRVLASDPNEELGKDLSDQEFFINGKEEAYIQGAEIGSSGVKRITVTYPIIDNGNFIGMVVGRINMEPIDKILAEKAKSGETGETYLVNKDKLMITPSRFLEDTFLNQEVDTLNSQHCFDVHSQEEHNVANIFLDYRGVSALGTHIYIPEMEWCLLAEIDEAEAFGIARNQLIKRSIINLIVMIIFVSIVGFIVARFVSRPIKKLTSDVGEVTRGKLDIQLGKSRIFEISALTDSLNRILASLKLAILKTGSSEGLGLGEAVKAKEVAEEKYKVLYESSRDAIMVLEPPTWKFTSGNPAAVKMFGAKDEAEFLSKSPGELSPVRQPDKMLSKIKAKEMIDKAMAEGSNFFDWTHKRINGEDFPAIVLLTKFKLGGKEVLQANVRDFSSGKSTGPLSKVVMAEKEKFEDMFNLSPDMMLIAKPDGTIVKINDTWERILGYTKDEIIKMGWTKLVHPDDVKKTEDTVRGQLKGSKVVNFVNRYKHKDGSYKTLKWQATYVKKGIVYASARDITPKGLVKSVVKVPQPALKKTIPPLAKKKIGSFEKKLQERAEEINRKRINRTLGKK